VWGARTVVLEDLDEDLNLRVGVEVREHHRLGASAGPAAPRPLDSTARASGAIYERSEPKDVALPGYHETICRGIGSETNFDLMRPVPFLWLPSVHFLVAACNQECAFCGLRKFIP